MGVCRELEGAKGIIGWVHQVGGAGTRIYDRRGSWRGDHVPGVGFVDGVKMQPREMRVDEGPRMGAAVSEALGVTAWGWCGSAVR